MTRIITDSIIRTAFSKRINVNIFNHTTETFVVRHAGDTLDHVLNRYMLHFADAFFCPADRFVMDRTTKSIVHPDLTLTQTDPRIDGFGSVIDRMPDGRRRVAFHDSELVIKGPAICISPWNSFAALIMQILMGICHSDDLVGGRLPILVPDDLTPREHRGLALIGVEADRLVPVPRHAATRVLEAIVPSKSYNRNLVIENSEKQINLGYIFEPNDLRSLNHRIRSRLDSNSQGSEVVLIARKDAGSRFISNEAALADAVQEFGGRYIVTTQTPIAETCQAVMDARVVICPHGSALLNMVAANSDTTLVEIDHIGNDRVGRGICRVLGPKYVLASRVNDDMRDTTNHKTRSADIDEIVSILSTELST